MAVSWQSENRVSCDRAQAVLALIPVVGLCLVMTGCSMTAHRAAIQYKARHMARLEQAMKPPLRESAAAIWWNEHGDEALATVAGALSLWLAAKRRAG